MESSTNKEVADMLTELIFRFSGAIHRSTTRLSGPKIQSHAFHILYLLERAQEKRLSMSFLLTELKMTKQQLSKIINELEEFGFIERMRTDRDRRNVFIRLTDRGSAYFQDSAKAVADHIEQKLEKKDPSRTETIRALLLQLFTF